MTPTSRETSGWTLVETMIALAVATVLLGMGVSSANGAISAVRANDARNALLATLVTARTQAVLRMRDVRLCPSGDGTNCLDSYHWESGWILFVDANDDNRKDAADPVLERHLALGSGVRLITSTGRRTVEVQPSAGNGGSNATFTLCDARGAAKATAFAMSNTGNLRAVPAGPEAVAEACRR